MTMFRASVVSLWLAVIMGTSAVHAQPVRIGVIGILPDAGIFVALEKGYFREAGVDLKLEPFVSSVKMLPALSTGDLEIATGGVAASLFNGIAPSRPAASWSRTCAASAPSTTRCAKAARRRPSSCAS